MTRDPVTVAWLQLLLLIPFSLLYGLILEFFRARKAGVQPSNERALWSGAAWGAVLGLLNLFLVLALQRNGTPALWLMVPVLLGVAWLAIRSLRRIVRVDRSAVSD